MTAVSQVICTRHKWVEAFFYTERSEIWVVQAPCFNYSAIYLVSNAKNPWTQRYFGWAVWNPMWIFLGQRLILFVHENRCNCASRGKFCANEFFKRAYKISKSRPHKRIFDPCKWTLRAANLRSVNAQLRVQSCPSNQNMGSYILVYHNWVVFF